MKTFYRNLVIVILIGLIAISSTQVTYAGNKDRQGQAGASELLINPWARSSGWGSVGIATTRGIESVYINVAGLAFTKGTELRFAETSWLKGSDINIHSFGFAQKMGESGALGVSIMSMTFGDIPITTTELPEGGIGTFSPNLMNVNIAYSRIFSNSIYGGFNLKILSESIKDMNAQGFALDAGIQYVTGEMQNIKFGITLKNLGASLKFNGDGLDLRTYISGQTSAFTMKQRAQSFELPAQLLLGAAYDFYLPSDHRLTLAGSFTSNSFSKDQFTGGLEYSFKSYLMIRAAYTYEDGITNSVDDPVNRTNAFNGLSGGFSVQVPLNKEKGSTFSVDYSYRSTDNFDGTHSIGASITL